MSSSEIAFLAFGLVLGGALGAALLAAARSRPAHRREVRLTIAPNAIPARRAATLATGRSRTDDLGFATPATDGAWRDGTDADPAPEDATGREADAPQPWIRTRVPSPPAVLAANAVAVPVLPAVTARPALHASMQPAAPSDATARRAAGTDPVSASLARSAVAIAVPEPAPASRAGDLAPALRPTPAPPPTLRPAPAPGPTASEAPGPGTAVRPAAEPLVRARPPVVGPAITFLAPMAGTPVMGAAPGAHGTARTTAPATPSDPCVIVRVEMAERCAEADAAADRARAAGDLLRTAKQEAHALEERLVATRAVLDPRVLEASKASLQAEYRRATVTETDRADLELATGRWMAAIDRVNAEARAAQRALASGEVELRERLVGITRLEAKADAARFTADAARSACQTARQALATCEEGVVTPAGADPEPHSVAAGWPTEHEGAPGQRPWTAVGLATRPLLVRILEGDRAARDQAVARIAGTDPAEAATWHLRLAALTDAITAAAIDDNYLDLPDDDAFWSLFTPSERRVVVRALTALGFRYDPLRGFADGRVPGPRDLSLAVGYAGLDRMRLRTWPRDADLASLYARATVAAPEWLDAEADDLALGPLMDALGSRAAGLGDVWNAWGRLRPLLVTPG